MSQEQRKDFFISYTSVDKPWAEWIAWQLEVAGFTTILQAWDFHAGGNFVLDMNLTLIHFLFRAEAVERQFQWRKNAKLFCAIGIDSIGEKDVASSNGIT